jgi:HlyD family secretion protein
VEKTESLGLQSDVTAQVLSGVSAGDQVILNPGATVSNGTLVKAN